jgi:hypothetical protein
MGFDDNVDRLDTYVYSNHCVSSVSGTLGSWDRSRPCVSPGHVVQTQRKCDAPNLVADAVQFKSGLSRSLPLTVFTENLEGKPHLLRLSEAEMRLIVFAIIHLQGVAGYDAWRWVNPPLFQFPPSPVSPISLL